MSVFRYYFLIIIYTDAVSAFSNTMFETVANIQLPHTSPHSSFKASSTYNPKTNNNNSVSLSISSTLASSAIDVLEEQYYNRPDTPFDSILRKYMKQRSRESRPSSFQCESNLLV